MFTFDRSDGPDGMVIVEDGIRKSSARRRPAVPDSLENSLARLAPPRVNGISSNSNDPNSGEIKIIAGNKIAAKFKISRALGKDIKG